MAGKVYVNICQQLLLNELVRSFALSCTAINSSKALSVAAIGFDHYIRVVNSTLANYDRSGLQYFAPRGFPHPFLVPTPIEEFNPKVFDAALVFSPDPQTEIALWDNLSEHRIRNDKSSGGEAKKHCSFLRFSMALRTLESVLLSLEPETFLSCLDISKLLVLSLAIIQSPADGLVLECGSYQGGSAVFTGQHLKRIRPTQKFHAFDTFAGIPAADEEDGGTPWTTGQFTDTSLSKVQGFIDSNGLGSQVTLHPGLITETFPAFLATNDSKLSLVFLDTDQYRSTKQCIENSLPRLAKNGLILIDDALDPGVALAIREVHQENPALKGYFPLKNMYILYQDTDENFNCSNINSYAGLNF